MRMVFRLAHFLFIPYLKAELFMGSLLLFLITLCFSCTFVSANIPSSEAVYPNFTASHFQFISSNGCFLFSRNGTFKASMYNPLAQKYNFYLCIIHVASNTIIWSANRNAPISESGKMTLTVNGLVIEEDGILKWSTPQLRSSVSSLKLTETGNLVLVNRLNETLWESFNHPTDTIVIGQRLYVGTSLFGTVSDVDLSTGDYSLSVTVSDAILKWQGQRYWKLSMDTKAYTNSNYAAEYMTINQTGLYLIGRNGSLIVVLMKFSHADFRIAKLDYSGQFSICTFTGMEKKQEYVGPADKCQIPFVCGKMGLCISDAASSGNPVCSCPPNFHVGSHSKTACLLSDGSYLLASSCNSTKNNNFTSNSSSFASYLSLGYGVDYFANRFSLPTMYGVNLSVCQELCSSDCSCLGVFFGNNSGSCLTLQHELGSFKSSSENVSDRLGFIKTLPGVIPNEFHGKSPKFPIIAIVLLPFSGFCLLLILGFFRWRGSKNTQSRRVKKVDHFTLPVSGYLDAFCIPGLPVRFKYEVLELATENFKTLIGCGGFGAVYKGRLSDKTFVAVKKITNLGAQSTKDFCTEIAVIGRVHHVNLVKLKGFCTRGTQCLLVYEYMNRGSLACTLFGDGSVIEWQERVDIALGVARGLAYLHSGCENKIIHLDVKPENILLHDNFQAKISDFGLSKLLGPDESNLFTTMRGTRGYLAPEWLTNTAISDKTDVYSFGMVILELVSGRKNCSLQSQSQSQGFGYFPLFALEMHEQGKYLELVDPRLEGRVTSQQAEKMVRVALCCVHEEPELRPTMVSVVGMLEGGETPILCQPRMESLNFLRFYGRRFSEASMKEGSSGNSDDLMVYPQENDSCNPLSFVLSEQISDPR